MQTIDKLKKSHQISAILEYKSIIGYRLDNTYKSSDFQRMDEGEFRPTSSKGRRYSPTCQIIHI